MSLSAELLPYFNFVEKDSDVYPLLEEAFKQQDILDDCFAQWLNKINSSQTGWVTDVKFDLNNDPNCELIIGNIRIPFEGVDYYTSPYHKDQFWLTVCRLIGRSPEHLKAQREVCLDKALIDFQENLNLIGVPMSKETIVPFVLNNSKALESRSLFVLNPRPQIEEHNMPPFWDHMQKIWNILNPYAQIHYGSDPSQLSVSNLFTKIGNVASNIASKEGENINIMAAVSELLNSNFMSDLKDLATDRKASRLFANILIPDQD